MGLKVSETGHEYSVAESEKAQTIRIAGLLNNCKNDFASYMIYDPMTCETEFTTWYFAVGESRCRRQVNQDQCS